jgi:hypothetical protein
MGLFQNEAKVDVTMKDVSKTIQYKYRHLDRLPVRNVHVILSYCNCIPRSSCSRAAAEEEAFYHKTRFYAVLWQRNTRRDTRHETMSKDWSGPQRRVPRNCDASQLENPRRRTVPFSAVNLTPRRRAALVIRQLDATTPRRRNDAATPQRRRDAVTTPRSRRRNDAATIVIRQLDASR